MKLQFLKEAAVADLRASVGDNLALYRAGDFAHLTTDPALSFQTDIVFNEKELTKLVSPSGKQFFDAENCAIMLRALPKLTPYEAADERLWTMLCHTLMLPHARDRWPIPEKDSDAIKHIQAHFFGATQRQLERDNVAARLWWMGHLCSRLSNARLTESLAVFLHRSDVRANIIERPTTAQSLPVFSALMRYLTKSYRGKKKLFERKVFRLLMVHLNGLGGYKLLDALDSKSVEGQIKRIISSQLKISEI
jgi:hypothetical protein